MVRSNTMQGYRSLVVSWSEAVHTCREIHVWLLESRFGAPWGGSVSIMNTLCLLRPCFPCVCGERYGLWPELIDAAQDLGEQRSRHRRLDQLEDDITPGTGGPGVNLDRRDP